MASAKVFVDGDWVESKDQDPDGDVRLVQLADVGDGEYINKSDRYLTSAKARALRCTFLEPGDILVARMPDPLGRACIFPGDSKRCVTVVDVCIIRPDPEKHEARWLMHCLNAPSCRNQINGFATGTTRSRISRGNLGKIKFPSAPLPEQRRIAEILDKADALQAKRRAALAQLDTLTQSIFLDMFGDPIANSKQWKRVEMADAVVGKYGIKAGPFGSSLKKEDYATSGYRIYGQEQVIGGRFDIGDYYISERKYQQLKSCAVAEGDLLVSLVGSFGKVLIVPVGIEPGIINPRLLKITPNQALVTPDFLASLLQHATVQAEFQRVAHGGTMGILNAGLLKQLKVILPPITLQREFARRVPAVEALKTAQCASLTELDALFANLQHRAFQGDL
jgi:type I restriction enzyme S subunit